MPGKVALRMTRHEVNADGSVAAVASSSFEAQINPSEFRHTQGIEYGDEKALGQTAARSRFKSVSPDTVAFALWLDATGALPASPDLRAQVRALRAVCYRYVGTEHEPPYVQIVWGSFAFLGRLSSMSVDYKLFTPEGLPLRAKVDLSFVSATTPQAAQAAAQASSPDLSHLVLVRDGDTLPLLCHRIYGDSDYCLEIAAHNGLAGFRRLRPGQTLHFPPLE